MTIESWKSIEIFTDFLCSDISDLVLVFSDKNLNEVSGMLIVVTIMMLSCCCEVNGSDPNLVTSSDAEVLLTKGITFIGSFLKMQSLVASLIPADARFHVSNTTFAQLL